MTFQLPEHVMDKADKPVLALIALGTDEIDVEQFITRAGPIPPPPTKPGLPSGAGNGAHQGGAIDRGSCHEAQEVRNRLEDLARHRARHAPVERPAGESGILLPRSGAKLDTTLAEREQALVTTVSQASIIAFGSRRPSGPTGRPRDQDRPGVKAGLRDRADPGNLSEAGELITADRATTQETLLSLSRLFSRRVRRRRWRPCGAVRLPSPLARCWKRRCCLKPSSGRVWNRALVPVSHGESEAGDPNIVSAASPARCRWTSTSPLPGGRW